MIITRIGLRAAGPYLFCEVETDNGLVGIGEAGDWAHLAAVRTEITRLSQYFVGKDPRRIEYHWQYIQRGTFFRSTVLSSALSAIDIALWDLKGKSLGVPICELVGGRARTRVRTYGVAHGETADEVAAACLRLKEQGFDAARVILPSMKRPTMQAVEHVHARRVGAAIEKVIACRDAVGGEFDLCVEAHRAYSVSEAIAIGRGIEAATPMFFEDPISPDSPEAMGQVTSAVSVPIATGERAVSLAEFATLLRVGVRILRPDVCVVGGLTPAFKAAALAEATEARIVPHNPLGPVSTAACLQLDLASSAFLIQEFPSFNIDGSEDSMLTRALELSDGYLSAPEGAGLGIALADDIETRFPARPRALHPAIGFDESVVAR